MTFFNIAFITTMSDSTSHCITIEPLQGTENFPVWKIKMSDILTVRGYPRVMLRLLDRLLSTGYYYLVSRVPILSIFLLSCVVLAMPVHLK